MVGEVRVRVRGHGQNGGLAQQSPAVLIGERDAPEVASVDAGYSVVTGELLVHESEVRCQQIDDTTVLFQLSIEEEIHLFHEGQSAGCHRTTENAGWHPE